MIITEPTRLENFESKDGLFRSTKDWTTFKKSGSYSACLHYDLAKLGVTLKYGQTVKITVFPRSGGFKPVGNWKLFRMWSALGKQPNTYIGTPHVEDLKQYGWRLFTEDLVHDQNALVTTQNAVPLGDGYFHYTIFSMQLPSSYAATDGYFSYLIDDKVILATDKWKCEGAGYKDPKTMKVPEFKGLPSLFCIQATYQDNGTGPLPDTAFCHVANPVVEIR